MSARELKMKERMSMMRTEYSVLKEVLKYEDCGWSYIHDHHKASLNADVMNTIT
jgi:hypothetical protein